MINNVLAVDGQIIQTDKEGYLLDSKLWSIDIAKAIAKLEDIEMTEERWQVVNFVRQFYDTYDTSPAIRALVKAMQNEYGPDKGNSRYLYRLFPKGPAKIATKLAGLPKPARCL
jgi:tRNA 2-thiouridine synthesizing protein E